MRRGMYGQAEIVLLVVRTLILHVILKRNSQRKRLTRRNQIENKRNGNKCELRVRL